MFSYMKKRECMEPELPDIFRVKVGARNVLFGSLAPQHQATFAMSCFFFKTHTNSLNLIVTLNCFACETVH